MAQIQHPAAREETAHLESTKETILSLTDLGQKELDKATEELAIARRFDPDALPLREMLYARASQNMKNLSLSYRKPYFTRVDFIEEGGDKQVYYIGKYGVMRPNLLDVVVVDWRAPIANLYYSGQVGPMHYVCPDGEVRGELTLKRQFGIEDGQLQTIFDTDVVSQDAYLQAVLGSMTGDRLREIVTTIQAEQNFVIRYPLNRSLVVQGVAGSGKTTIALHRIAYLLYAFPEQLRPEHMLILAPNPLFLNFIAGVLPDLGVDRVRQTTFELLVREWLGKAIGKVDRIDPLETVLGMPAQEQAEYAGVAHAKGDMRMEQYLNEWLDGFEQNLPLKGDLKFGPVTVYTQEQIRKFLLEDEKFFPLARRLSEFQKDLTRRTKEACVQVQDWLRQETDRRADKLRVMEKDPETRRQRLTRLYDSRDQRLEEAKERIKPFIKDTMARFPSLAPMELYRSFWQDVLSDESADTYMRLAAERTLAMPRGKLTREDIAPLALVAMRAMELPRLDIRHIVIDEAQDFSELECLLLKRMSHSASMTVVGDLMQGIKSFRGMTDWRALTDSLFEGKAAMHHLVTSYRSTIEIMNTALRVARKRPVPGQQAAQPVLRHGEEPEFVRFTTAKEQTEALTRVIEAWKQDGIQNICVIDRTDAQLKSLLKRLPEHLAARLLDVEQEEYQSGLLLARASDVKGFEFDGVIVADASVRRYPDEELSARVLYVCLTRPLHRLACLYENELTELL